MRGIVSVAPASARAGARKPPDPWLIAAEIFDPTPWEPQGRFPLGDHQRPPPAPWSLWLFEGGRGSGKTEGTARYFAGYMRTHPGHRGRIIAPTFGDAVEACIEGPSGLLAIDPEIRWLSSAPGGAKVCWPNGSEALVLGTPFPRDVDRLRAGGNRHIDWWEEMAANVQLKKAWDQAQFGLRLGQHPHSIASTTPRGTADYREIRKLPGVTLTHGTLFQNPGNPPEWVDYMRARYEGTRLGRQELAGELLEDVEGALWDRKLLDQHRVAEHPDLRRIVIAVDPAVTSGEDADDTGIIAAGLGVDRHCYILRDRTCHVSPDTWAKSTGELYDELEADKVIAEINNGGEMVVLTLRTHNRNLPVKVIHASRGKRVRAEPVAALYEQGRVHHVGGYPELEDQLCTWTPEESDSPDRMDALVFAVTELMLGAGGPVKVKRAQGRLPRRQIGRI